MGDNVRVFLKVFCILYLVFVVPSTMSWYNERTAKHSEQTKDFLIGIEHFVKHKKKFTDIIHQDVGLVVEATPLHTLCGSSEELLVHHGLKLKKIFRFVRNKQGYFFPSVRMPLSRLGCSAIPTVELYESELMSTDIDFFSEIDVLIVDIDNFGTRDDRSVLLLKTLMDNALRSGKKLVVTDRINPLGDLMEGPGSIPLRHGMTLAELARYFNKYEFSHSVDLVVVPMLGWHRNNPLPSRYDQDHAYTRSYEFCLLRCLGAIGSLDVVTTNNQEPALMFSSCNSLSAWEFDYLKQLLGRLDLVVKDVLPTGSSQNYGLVVRSKSSTLKRSLFSSFLTLVRFFNNRKGLNLTYPGMFDSLMVDDEVKQYLQGYTHRDYLEQILHKRVHAFYTQSKECFLYEPFPHVVRVNREEL